MNDADALKAARAAVDAARSLRDQMRMDWGHFVEPEETLAAEVDRLKTERDRLRAQLHELMSCGADAVDLMNAEYGCPDCGVHRACGQIVAERDQLRAIVAGCSRCAQRAALTPESLGETEPFPLAELDETAEATDG